MAPKPRITIRFEGDPADKGNVRLADFAAKVSALFQSLAATEALMPDEDRARVYYRIVELRQESPATMTVEVVSARKETPRQVVQAFTNTIRALNSKHHLVPPNATPDQLAAFAALTPTTDTHLAKVVVIPRGIKDRKQVVLRQEKPNWIPIRPATSLGEADYSFGSVAGHLDIVNVHEGANRAHLYPKVGPRITCSFSEALKSSIKAGLDKYVRVHGRLKFLPGEDFPKEIDKISEIEIYEADDALPRFQDLAGIAPGATEGMNIRDFVESLYDDVDA